jgi:hypothetical protein
MKIEIKKLRILGPLECNLNKLPRNAKVFVKAMEAIDTSVN